MNLYYITVCIGVNNKLLVLVLVLDRILPRYLLSRVRVSIRHRIFYTPKNPEPVARSPTGPVACFSATDRQNGAI